MIGHEKIVLDLRGLQERGSLGHGYVFHGPSMVGKRTAAMAFANFLEKGEFGESVILSDLMVVEPGENGSIGIDAARGIKNFLWQKPNASPRRTLIIDDAELLTTEAQNALLKITEEPPSSSLLILVTSDADSILPTITSRLPKIFFGTVPEKDIEQWLAENGEDKKQAKEIVRKVMGKPGLAWRLLHDEALQGRLELAGKLLKSSVAARRDLIKKILEPDEFNFRKFLDAVIMDLAWQGTQKKNSALWHRALQLYDRETNFSLNPRLQLESLLG